MEQIFCLWTVIESSSISHEKIEAAESALKRHQENAKSQIIPTRVVFLSRVTPGVLCTIASFLPASRLNSVDFPTFGRPTIAIENKSVANDEAGSAFDASTAGRLLGGTVVDLDVVENCRNHAVNKRLIVVSTPLLVTMCQRAHERGVYYCVGTFRQHGTVYEYLEFGVGKNNSRNNR